MHPFGHDRAFSWNASVYRNPHLRDLARASISITEFNRGLPRNPKWMDGSRISGQLITIDMLALMPTSVSVSARCHHPFPSVQPGRSVIGGLEFLTFAPAGCAPEYILPDIKERVDTRIHTFYPNIKELAVSATNFRSVRGRTWDIQRR
jgi:hypothetical protein